MRKKLRQEDLHGRFKMIRNTMASKDDVNVLISMLEELQSVSHNNKIDSALSILKEISEDDKPLLTKLLLEVIKEEEESINMEQVITILKFLCSSP